jgi:glycosyltransferase involved in cell wall biosynthesis
VKNRAWCIDECVKSVLSQDYPNIEYIVQDGGSTDGTLEALAKYGDRVKVYSQIDSGPMDAFRLALRNVTGEFLGMILSDERFADPGVVARTVAAFELRPNVGVVYGDFRVVDRQYREIRVERKRQFDFETIFSQEDFISPCAAFVRTSALLENGAPRADLMRYFGASGDFGLWVHVASILEIKYVSGVMADFMLHKGAVTYNLDHAKEYLRDCERAIAAYQGGRYSPDGLRRLKKRALSRAYFNYANLLADQYADYSWELATKALLMRPRLVFTRTFVGIILRSLGLYPIAQWIKRA